VGGKENGIAKMEASTATTDAKVWHPNKTILVVATVTMKYPQRAFLIFVFPIICIS